MQVSCPQCATRLQLSAAKLPAQPFTIKCPKCQTDFTISPHLFPKEDAPVSPTAPPLDDDLLGLFDESPAPVSAAAPSPAPLPPPVPPPSLTPPTVAASAMPTAPPPQNIVSAPPSGPAPHSSDWSSAPSAVAVGWTNSMPAPTVEDDSNMLVTGQAASQDILQALASLLTSGMIAKPSKQIEQNRRRNVVICMANAEDIGHVQSALLGQGYGLTVAESPEQVTSMLQMSHQLDILLLDPNFHAAQQGGATIMRYLNMLNPARRRRVFVVVTSHSYRSMDMQAAFIHGVNLVVNSAELDILPGALSKSIQEFNNLYRAFNEASGASPF